MASGEQLSVSTEQFEAQTLALVAEQAQVTRDYVAGQVDDWQQLPVLALRANGKNGWRSQFSMTSEYGVVRVGSGKHFADNPEQRPVGLYGVYVDCSSGNLLRLFGDRVAISSPEALADDNEVFHLWATQAALGKLSVLSAKTHIESLDRQIREPLGSWRTLEEEDTRLAGITEEISRRGLTSRFVRG